MEKMTKSTELAEAYDYCLNLAHSHYENFPVASLLLPRHLRKAICVIYAFSRTADDIADEGNATPLQRLNALAEYEQQLSSIEQGNYQGNSAIFIALQDVIQSHDLPITLLYDLLSAFQQDITQHRYQNDDAIYDYCRRSANPIGRLLLHLHGEPTKHELKQSDAICTALQLINFYQDIQQDLYENDRIYIPLDDFIRHGLTTTSLHDTDSHKTAPILREKLQTVHTLFSSGFKLGDALHGRFGWEIRIVTLMGIVTLNKLSSRSDHDLYSRPRLSKYHFALYATLALSPRIYCYFSQKYLNKVITSARY
jgi:squalene synthase HpnC